ncbi:MAG: beta-ketoacyl-ACP synthase [Agarilytica sp.]
MNASDIVIVDYEATCAAGTGLDALRNALKGQKSGLRKNDIPDSDLQTWIGRVPGLEDVNWDESNAQWQSRNNALIRLGLEQGHFLKTVNALKTQFASDRIGVVMGSSTSSIDRAETAYQQLGESERLPKEFNQEWVLNPHAPALYVAEFCGLDGPSITINTACSSSAKVFATAARWLQLNLVDAVVVGGADTLCLSVLHGFHSLQLVSENRCRPFDEERDGINLGEAAGFAVLARQTDVAKHSNIKLSGYGESSDAHHMSHPHPEGLGARLAIEQALNRSNLSAQDIGYINLHGTASKANDHIEGNLIGKMFCSKTVSSSTKGWMGHTLGAAGIMESIIALDALNTGLIPGTLNLNKVDAEIPIQLTAKNQEARLKHVMSNSFGFGGNNCCLVFSEVNV